MNYFGMQNDPELIKIREMMAHEMEIVRISGIAIILGSAQAVEYVKDQPGLKEEVNARLIEVGAAPIP